MHAALQAIEPLYRENPGDPVLTAYYADCLSMTGKDAMDTASVFGSAIKSIKLFDEILEKHPENVEARLIRICHSFRLPEAFFRRAATAVKDTEYLIEAYEQKKIVLSEEMVHKLLYLLGKGYEQMGLESEAPAVWNKLLSMNCSDRLRELASKASDVQTDSSDMEQMLKNTNHRELFKKAKQLHELARNGDAKAAVQAVEILEKLHEAHPEVPIIEGYYGSSIALAGKNAKEAQELFGSAIKGMKHLNQAIDAEKENARLRYLRASLCCNLPEAFFHQGEKACADFSFTAEACEKDKSILTEDQYCRMLFDYGLCCRRLGKETEAEKVWNKLMQTYPDSPYTQEVKRFGERSVKG